ncbi:hypothetical protein RBG61_04785 [Paludicola sp. MB14-C6]|uniref:hypothetical protein n=1 Tax=Paludihabitans sp. MB14-C6 TaxID=3070656 RepID=UPI0027DDA0B0|nr:hypothetical protein [Paludicola sp. MB14-C6]WMJ23989.1 hypothetical protein RBG61_04785 [Paludicola sp. MB14-C6]
MDWFRKLMTGRYGPDTLGIALTIIGLVVSMIGTITGLFFIMILSYLIIGWALFRMFSKNITKRYKENTLFLSIWNPVKYKTQTTVKNMSDTKTHRHFKCPNCKQKVRVPKGRGKVNITCPNCRTQFIKKT